ncbi:hypothetical protein [Sphingomonas sp.]|uniref:hypothetical protein n=1 Tax=Sphingomonas sp. TaxID=28214 RepID=UPI003CC53EF4
MTTLALLLAACQQHSQPQRAQSVPDTQRSAAPEPHFPCAHGGGPLRPECTAERSATPRGTVLTFRHPDGHFRRLLIKSDDVVAAADGAEPAHVTRTAQGVEVSVGPDHYRLPVVP